MHKTSEETIPRVDSVGETRKPSKVRATDSDWFLACHEVGHAAIVWHFRGGLDDGGVEIDAATGRGRFHVRCHYNGGMVAEVLRNTKDATARAFFSRDVERTIIRLLGGPVAECVARAWEQRTAIRFADEYRDTGSDSSRIRDLLRGLTGKDDKKYQLRLQIECNAILTEERTWRAVAHIGKMLLETGKVSGAELNTLFADFNVPHTTSW